MFNRLERLEDLQHGDVLLTRVRKIHNLDPNKTKNHANYKVQIECAEHVVNEFRPLNATSVFNEGDSRFTGNRPRRGWVTMEPDQWTKYFGTGSKENLLAIEDIDKLQFSSTSHQDVANPMEQKNGIHFITLNVLNPYIEYGGQKLYLHIKITESTFQRNPKQPAKINPSNNQVQTQNGEPIFVTSQVDFGKQKSVFLLSDQMLDAIKSGQLTFTPEVMEKYHLTNFIGLEDMINQKVVNTMVQPQRNVLAD